MGGMDYIERRFNGRYFIFGESKDGLVDIADSEDSTVVGHISKEHAEKMIAKRDALMDCLVNMALAFQDTDDGAFHRFWWSEDQRITNADR